MDTNSNTDRNKPLKCEGKSLNDAEEYKYLISNKPEGKMLISEAEQAEFEAWMDAHRKG
ncbi:MAG: hypothetical protein Q4F93_10550 [bacterium]|nr:hypothetical protein [bacterium]